MSLLPKMEVEVVVADNMADDVVKAVVQAAHRVRSATAACSCSRCSRAIASERAKRIVRGGAVEGRGG